MRQSLSSGLCREGTLFSGCRLQHGGAGRCSIHRRRSDDASGYKALFLLSAGQMELSAGLSLQASVYHLQSGKPQSAYLSQWLPGGPRRWGASARLAQAFPEYCLWSVRTVCRLAPPPCPIPEMCYLPFIPLMGREDHWAVPGFSLVYSADRLAQSWHASDTFPGDCQSPAEALSWLCEPGFRGH